MGSTVTTAGFCAGVGMLDLGVAIALEWLGFRHQPALYCEWDAYSAACLLSRMEDKSLEPCPIWCGDLGQFDGKPFRGAVDIAIAGLPCTPYSVAGKQLGHADHRSYGDGSGPLPQFLRIVSEMRPAMVFLENVPAWVTAGWFRLFGEELCGLGYEIADPVFITAESVGASHRRERVFILAVDHATNFGMRIGAATEPERNRTNYGISRQASCDVAQPASGGLGELRQSPGRNGQPDGSDKALAHSSSERRQQITGSSHENEGEHAGRSSDAANEPPGCEPDVADTTSAERRREDTRPGSLGRVAAGRPSVDVGNSDSGGIQRRLAAGFQGKERFEAGPGEMANTSSSRLQERTSEPGDDGQQRAAAQRGCGIFAPGPSDFDGWRRVVEDGSFDYIAPAIKPGLRVLASRMALVVDQSRTDQLRCIGNGCVPLCASVAFVHLFQRLQEMT